jgi:hypothetical protein
MDLAARLVTEHVTHHVGELIPIRSLLGHSPFR